jgi:acyl transferase domain-containing protein
MQNIKVCHKGKVIREASAKIVLAIGTSSSMLSNRVSWFYDLRGSSVTVDTACSSSLIGLHHGCHSLLQGESDMVSHLLVLRST